MIGSIDSPTVFSTGKPEALKAQLERQARGLIAARANMPNEYQKRFSVGPIVTSGVAVASFGQATRVGPLDAYTVNIVLPKPNPKNGGLLIPIVRTSNSGAVFISGNGATVNLSERVMLPAAPGFYSVLFDGSNYWTTADAVPWDEGI